MGKDNNHSFLQFKAAAAAGLSADLDSLSTHPQGGTLRPSEAAPDVIRVC